MRRLLLLIVVPVLVIPTAAAAQTAPIAPAACQRLATLAFSNTTITAAEVIPAGAFMPPGAGGAGGAGRGGGGGGGGIPAVPGRVTLGSAGLGLGYNGGRPNAQFSELPAFCRVTATMTPSATSDIRAEVWLP